MLKERSGRGRGDFGRREDEGPPKSVVASGTFLHPCEDLIVLKSANKDTVPFFNAPIFLENKQQIGKVDEIFGHVKDYYFSVKLSEKVKANSFKKNDKLFIDPAKLIPLQRFTAPQSRGAVSKRGAPGGRVRGSGRGGGFRGRAGCGRGGGFGGRGGGGRGGGGRGGSFNGGGRGGSFGGSRGGGGGRGGGGFRR